MIATYRLQFHRDFTLTDLRDQLDYFETLGVDTIYASPILTSTPGSTHGYDVTDPTRLDPEITTPEEWDQIQTELHDRGFQWMQDIVPNHTALSPHNVWLADVFRQGPESRYYRHFDIDWAHPRLPGRMLLPVLGEDLKAAIQGGAIEIEDGFLKIYGRAWALRERETQTLKGPTTSGRFEVLPPADGAPGPRSVLADEIAGPLSVDTFTTQYYQPAHWQSVNDFINYRRFFTVNELICMRTEDETVFDDLHARTLEDVRAGRIDHLRIDHVDGLTDPTGYLQRLRQAVGPDVGIYVEKILEPGEQLPTEWPVQGTTGYDFLAATNRLLTNYDTAGTFSALYEDLTAEPLPDYHELVFRNKLMLVREHFSGELDNLVRRWARLVDFPNFRQTLAHWLAAFPVYRIYPTGGALKPEELERCQEAAVAVTHYAPEQGRAALAFTNWLAQTNFAGEALETLQRTQQLSGPLMAKGVEDTTFYQFWRQAHLNEVGSTAAPEDRLPARAFHQFIQSRPNTTMNATATHDTKRGEDGRAFLQALTFYPEAWEAFVVNVRELVHADPLRPRALYLVLQSLVSSYPLHKPPAEANLRERLHRYLEKALREGKEMSNWAEPNVNYEGKVIGLADELLDSKPAVELLEGLLRTIWPQVRHNSFAQTILKCTVPGIPDVYQGTESWDMSLVDPDNRRPVDYAKRRRWLAADEPVDDYQPALKARLLRDLLHLRCSHAEFFLGADYEPLAEGGEVLAFRRQYSDRQLIVRIAKRVGDPVAVPEGGMSVLPAYCQPGLGVWFGDKKAFA